MMLLLMLQREIFTSVCGGGLEQTTNSMREANGTPPTHRVLRDYMLYASNVPNMVENCSKLVPLYIEPEAMDQKRGQSYRHGVANILGLILIPQEARFESWMLPQPFHQPSASPSSFEE